MTASYNYIGMYRLKFLLWRCVYMWPVATHSLMVEHISHTFHICSVSSIEEKCANEILVKCGHRSSAVNSHECECNVPYTLVYVHVMVTNDTL